MTLLGFALAGAWLLVGPGSLGLLLVLLGFPAFLVLGYLFYPVPYLVVLRGRGLANAIRGSLGLAADAAGYFRYTLGFLVFSALVSVLGTAVVVNLGIVGILAGAVAAAPLGLALNLTTLRFLADIDDASPSVGVWSTDDGGASPPTDRGELAEP